MRRRHRWTAIQMAGTRDVAAIVPVSDDGGDQPSGPVKGRHTLPVGCP
jgi:hypothetical protein